MNRAGAGAATGGMPTATGSVNGRTTERLRRQPAGGTTLLLACLVLLVPAAVNMGNSLWGDEGFTARMTQRPWRDMMADLAHIDVNMGLYYALVKVVTAVVGTSEAGLRTVSVLAAVATVPLIARLAQRQLGHRTGATAGVIFAANPFVVDMSVNARPYALLLFGTAGTSLLVLRAVQRGRLRDWTVWALACAALLYVHLLATLVIVAQGCYLLLHVWRGRRGTAPPLRRRWWVGPAVALVVLVVAAIPTWLFIAPQNTLAWVASPTVLGMGEAVVSALGRAVFAVPLLVLAAIGSARLWRDRFRTGELVSALLVVPAALILALLPVQNLVSSEYLSMFTVPVSLLAAHGIGRLRLLWRPRPGSSPRVRQAVAAVLVLLGLLTSGWRTLNGSLPINENWRAANARLNALVSAHDGVAFPNSFYRIVAEYYAERTPGQGWTRAQPVLPQAAWNSLSPYQLDRIKRLGQQDSPAVILAQTAQVDSVWLVGPQEYLLENAENVLTHQGWQVTHAETRDGITLVQLRRP